MLREQRDHVLLRQRIDDAALATDDALGAPQRVATASSVASAVAAKRRSSSWSARRSPPRAVEKARKISPLPW
jgi:uncharacterized protein YciW